MSVCFYTQFKLYSNLPCDFFFDLYSLFRSEFLNFQVFGGFSRYHSIIVFLLNLFVVRETTWYDFSPFKIY